MQWNIDIVIFVGFLILNLVVGLFYGRGVKTIKDYALGGRNFSTATLAATIIATWMAGSNLSITAYETYAQGLYYVVPGLADGISFFIVAYFYAPRMAEFLGSLSVAETMGVLYGRYVRLITAISAIIISIGNVSVQFAIFTTLLNYFFGISGIYAAIISALIVIAYSTFGGIKSVTFTDMIQFFTFGIILPMSVFIIWKSIGNPDAVFNTLTTNPNFNYQKIFNIHNSNFRETLFLFLFFIIPGLDPIIFQRISMAKNTKQVSKSFTIAGLAMMVIEYGAIAFIGVLLLASNVQNLDSDNLIGYLLDHYFNNSFKGLFIIGLMAMLMSTADSYINSASVLFTNDICKSIGINLSSKSEMIAVRIFALSTGVLALLLSLYSKNLLDLILSTYSFYMPVVSVPLILAIFGFRSTSKAALMGMLAGFTTVVIIKLNFEISSLIPGMMANIIFFMGSHYLLGQSGGWVGIKDSLPLDDIRSERKQKLQRFIRSITEFDFTEFLEKNLPREEKTLVYFGLFSIISIFSNAYTLADNPYADFFEVLYYCGLTLAMIFITYPVWLDKFKNKEVVGILWHIAVFFNLAFINILFLIFSKFNAIQTTIVVTNLITIAVLMRWQIAMLVIITGAVVAIKFYKSYVGVEFIPENINTIQFKIVHSLLFISAIMVAFLKPKQEREALIEGKNEHLTHRIEDSDKELAIALGLKNEFISNINHEYNAPMTGIKSMVQILRDHYDKFDDQVRKQAIDGIYESSLRLERFDNNLTILSKLNRQSYQLSLKLLNLSELLYDRIEICRKLYVPDNSESEAEFILNIESDIMCTGDKDYLTKTLDNLIINAIRYCSKGKITITLGYGNNNIEFAISDEGIGIPRAELWDIFEPFVTSSKSYSPTGGRGIGLAVCKKVITVHGGEIRAESDGIKGATFSFTIPINYHSDDS